MSTLQTKTVRLGDSATLANNFELSVPAVPDGTITFKRQSGALGLSDFADDAAASAGGVPVGGLYRTGSILKIRVA